MSLIISITNSEKLELFCMLHILFASCIEGERSTRSVSAEKSDKYLRVYLLYQSFLPDRLSEAKSFDTYS
jgi:hypothetical protein